MAISSPAISRMRSFIRALRRCQASPPSWSSARASLARAVAREHVDILDRHVELVAARIGQRDAVVRLLADRDRGQPFITADAVLDMDDQIAGRKRRQLGEEGVGDFLRLLAANQAVAEHVLLGEQRDVGRGEAMIERQDDQGDAPVGDAQRLLPAVDLHAADRGHDPRAGPTGARVQADGIAGEDRLLALARRSLARCSATAS